MKRLMLTDGDLGRFVVRLVLGIALLPAGVNELLEYGGTMHFFTKVVGLPFFVAFLIILIHSFGALSLIVGFLGRLAAFGILCDTVRVVHMNLDNGLISYGYHFLASGMALSVILGGSGAFSVDRAITRRTNPSR